MSSLLNPGVRYLTDSGLETTLVFHDGIELPAFAAFPLVEEEAGRDRLRAYYREHADLAKAHGMGFVFEAPTWRANTDWGESIGYTQSEINAVNREAIALMREIEANYPMMATLVSGQIGPRGDGYQPTRVMSAEDAADYHAPQIAAFVNADLVTALTINYVDEAVGIVMAARRARMPVVISFTTETDGRLPDGQELGDAIMEVDERTNSGPAYYMLNCAHPQHFMRRLDGPFASRIGGLRANASTMSHAELDQCEALDIGDPMALAADYADLRRMLPALSVYGGCCGTDIRHIGCIAHAIAPAAAAA
ncbi:homocysteine S-methyltransferase family protein [Acuticoccus kandeliae]|uniref:homocysteine S-methyltransferase family protein n=1 Tax=Acuticoccus kandeliae TaxID=2073160 RepID=UPI000D3E430E|nr:homocysteine S-methyltransferase family protein [Acuticoccus kandeliae]